MWLLLSLSLTTLVGSPQSRSLFPCSALQSAVVGTACSHGFSPPCTCYYSCLCVTFGVVASWWCLERGDSYSVGMWLRCLFTLVYVKLSPLLIMQRAQSHTVIKALLSNSSLLLHPAITVHLLTFRSTRAGESAFAINLTNSPQAHLFICPVRRGIWRPSTPTPGLTWSMRCSISLGRRCWLRIAAEQ